MSCCYFNLCCLFYLLNILSALFPLYLGSRTYCKVFGVGADVFEDWVESDLLQDRHTGGVRGED